MSYYYDLFGLVLKSEIEFQEYQLCVRNINTYDIEIVCGKIIFPGEKFGNHRRIFVKDSIYLYVKDIATYRMFKGKTIYVDPDPKASLEQIKAFLTGTCMGALLYQRGSLVIHGGVAEINNYGVIVMGDCGSGKSTLIAALRNKGHGFISDDMAVFSNEGIEILPGYPGQRICAENLTLDEAKSLGCTAVEVVGKSKYIMPVNQSFKSYSVSAGIIVELVVGKNTERLQWEKLKGEERLRVIIENIYGIRSIRFSGSKMDCFKRAAEVAKEVPVYRIIRPSQSFTVEEEVSTVEYIMNLLNERPAI